LEEAAFLAVLIKMGKKLFFLAMFLFLILNSFYFVGAGCTRNNINYNVGDIILNNQNISHYCGLSGNFIPQKAENSENSSCMNDFECLCNSCVNDKCINVENLEKELRNLSLEIEGYDLSAGPCRANPGCLNISSIANGVNISKLCAYGFKCFTCNEDYEWSGNISIGCRLMNCSYNPGCLNESSFANAHRITRNCSAGYSCFVCNSGYSWVNKSCILSATQPDGSYFWGATFPVSSEQFQAGYTTSLLARQRLQVYIKGGYHYIGIVSINSGAKTALINVSSVSQQAVFDEDDERNFDVDEDSVHDLKVKLNSIRNARANITISPAAPADDGDDDNDNGDDDNESPDEQGSKLLLIIIIIFVALIIIVVGVIIWFVIKSNKEQDISKKVWKPNQPSQPSQLGR
jgi:hypothetical protein